MLLQRIKILKNVLGFTNTDLAKIMDCSPSHISKLCSGKSALSRNGQAALQFAQAVIVFANEHGAHTFLQEISATGNIEEDARKLSDWLYGDGTAGIYDFSRADDADEHAEQHFGKRFSGLMDVLQLSNVRVSRLLNVDASLISRFRTGKRSPRRNEQFSQLLCGVLADRMQQTGEYAAVSKLTGISETELQTAATQALIHWLFDRSQIQKPETHAVDYLNLFIPLAKNATQETLQELMQTVEKNKASTYWGMEGMQNAVLRLLTETAVEGDGEIYMYADQSMQWLLSDMNVLQLWYRCCAVCIARNVHIVIIHDINRKIDEMANAMQVWVPLYMTGRVTPYYCPLNRGSRFSHMLFLRPSVGAVSSVHVQGAGYNFYDYIQDAGKLEALHSEFMLLLSHSEKLVNTYEQHNMKKYYSILDPKMKATEGSAALLNAPSTVTLPDSVLREMIERSSLTAEEGQLILSVRRHASEKLKSGKVLEIFPIPSPDTVREGNLFLCMGSSLYEGGPYYTPEEYNAHLREIIRLIRNEPNYHCCLISQSLFSGMRMIITDGCAVMIRLQKPYTAFVVENEYFVKAFAVLIQDFYKQHRIPAEKMVEWIEKCLLT